MDHSERARDSTVHTQDHRHPTLYHPLLRGATTRGDRRGAWNLDSKNHTVKTITNLVQSRVTRDCVVTCVYFRGSHVMNL